MMTIDGKIFKEEMDLCVIFGNKFGYNNVHEAIVLMIQDIKNRLPMENTRKSVDLLIN